MANRPPKAPYGRGPNLYASGQVLSIFAHASSRRRTLETATVEMMSARLAIAVRDRPPEAVAIAILQAHRRGQRSN